jgi:Family of unknown function (DUF6186)
MKTLAIAGWIAIFGVLFVWEGIGLTRGSDWPTVSDMVRSLMAFWPTRVFLFAMWLWLGWHLFIRHWEFFLRPPT